MLRKDIVTIGGSAGSLAVLKQLLAELPADFPATLFVAVHGPSRSPGYLAEALTTVSKLPVERAIDGRPIERSRVYIAVPDRHLLITGDVIRLGDGPRENMAKPAIDPLFRSAALSHGGRVVGVVLSGRLNDGASGLNAIKACGGTAVVQHPLDAEADQMPLAALEAVAADEIATSTNLASVLAAIVTTDAGVSIEPPPSIALEVRIAAGGRLGSRALRDFADPSALSCPDCHGVLSEVRGERPLRYRCQIGHAHTADSLASQTGELDEAMHVALRVMEERVTLVTRMAEDARTAGRMAVAELYAARADEYASYADVIRGAAISSLRLGGREGEEEV